QGKFLRWNKNFEETSGYSAGEIVRMSPLDLFDEPDKKIVAAAIQKAFITGQASVEADFLAKDKTRTPCFFTGKIFLFEKKPSLIGMGIDITERKQAEKALLESEKKFRNILENIEDGYYEVDIAGNFIFFNDSMCRILGYPAEELMGKNNRGYMNDENAKKIFDVFNEVYRTGIPTRAFDWELIRKDGSKCFVETIVSLIKDSNNIKTGFRGIARDVTERKRAEEELEDSFKRLRAALGATIHAVSVTVETRDPYTAGHQKRVADLSRAIATEMGLDINRTDGIRMAGVIHDLGKMAIPAEILSKPSKLSAIEYALIKTHPRAGYDILKDVEFPWPIAQIVLQHHERLNGSGYPAGLKGEEILLEARVIAVADVVEAIASYRPYRPSQGMEKALGEIIQNRGILYDPEVVDACLCLFRDKGYKF
ncbi:MAG: PAS domain S-box protein, partial [Desulfobacterales bacterium]